MYIRQRRPKMTPNTTFSSIKSGSIPLWKESKINITGQWFNSLVENLNPLSQSRPGLYVFQGFVGQSEMGIEDSDLKPNLE